MADVAPLTRLLQARLAEMGKDGKPMSPRAAAAYVDYLASYETLRQIKAGVHSGQIDEKTVQALVRLGLSERDVRRAAGQQVTDAPGPFRLPDRASRLTRAQRDVVLSVVDTILGAAEGSGTVVKMPTRSQPEPDLREKAARRRKAGRSGRGRGSNGGA